MGIVGGTKGNRTKGNRRYGNDLVAALAGRGPLKASKLELKSKHKLASALCTDAPMVINRNEFKHEFKHEFKLLTSARQ